MPKDEGKKSRFGRLFGLDPTLGLGGRVLDHVEKAQAGGRERLRKSDYYGFCPNCGKKQIKRGLLENGCIVCGWKSPKDHIEPAAIKLRSTFSKAEPGRLGYKTECPQCGATVITEKFLQNGCWRCGYKD